MFPDTRDGGENPNPAPQERTLCATRTSRKNDRAQGAFLRVRAKTNLARSAQAGTGAADGEAAAGNAVAEDREPRCRSGVAEARVVEEVVDLGRVGEAAGRAERDIRVDAVERGVLVVGVGIGGHAAAGVGGEARGLAVVLA